MPRDVPDLAVETAAAVARPHRARTIEDVLRLSDGPTSGFDYLRVILASAVIVWHAFPLSYGPRVVQAAYGTVGGFLVLLVVPSFFALSGFLVTSSLIRVPSLIVYLGLRALRIVPALAVEICLSAMILGPIVTDVPLDQYFASPDFGLYFENILGRIHYTLPGVFLDNPYAGVVNGSLWTVPYEAECYIALAALSLLRVAKLPRSMLLAFIGLSVLFFAYMQYRGIVPLAEVGLPGRMLILFFLAGVLIRVGSASAPFNRVTFAAALACSAVTFSVPALVYLAPLPVAYVTVYLGLQRPPKLPLLFTGDYSYGLYLYAFPVQQLVSHLLPGQRHWYVNLPLSLTLTFVLAVFSWHVVEKRCLSMRRLLTRTRLQPVSSGIPVAVQP